MKRIANRVEAERFSITPSGFFGSSSDNIVEIPNFMTKEELEKISTFAKNIKHWDYTETHYNEDGTITYESEYWKDRVATQMTIDEQDLTISPMINKIVNRLKIIVDDFFQIDALPTPPAIVRWLPGQFQNPHADKELHQGDNAGKPNDFPYYDLAGLFYLNDDYEGGELYFPKQGIQFKPKKGAAYFFPGDLNYIHGVTEITSGVRYTCPFFWTIMSHKDRNV
jgi:predicted 2-oxoglutarate/Fe(II)-dependent dioxygenase YbiX